VATKNTRSLTVAVRQKHRREAADYFGFPCAFS
jgi:hypothetical protein